MKLKLAGALLLLLAGCQAPEPQCTETDCSAICKRMIAKENAPGNAPKTAPSQPAADKAPADAAPQAASDEQILSAQEAKLLAPVLEEMREGVRPRGEAGLGICKGQGKTCESFLGKDVKSLPPGDYMLRAELDVPNLGPKGTWQVEFSYRCTVNGKETEKTREYDVVYAGESRGYRLSPLVKITSPSPEGSRSCEYTLVTPSSQGSHTYSGSWTIPQGS